MLSRTNIISKSLRTIIANHDFKMLNQVKHSSTFHQWTLDYFRNQPHYNKFVLKQSKVDENKFVNNPVHLKTISTNELLIKLSSTNIKYLYFEIDKELLNRVNDMSVNQILVLMDECLSEKSQQYKNSRTFRKLMEVMDELWFRRPELTAYQTIQLIYYVSIFKNKSKRAVEFGIKKLINEINYLKQLNDEELSILAVATYKSSAKVPDKILRIFAFRIEKNLDTLIQNPLNFVSLIKPLKKAKYHDPKLFSLLITAFNNTNNNKVLQDVTSSIHLLTYFADANYGNVDFLQQMIDSIGNMIIKDNLENYRIKDVSNFVFSISYLGLTPKNPNVCKIISNFMDNIFNSREKCQKLSTLLIGMCLSMWMLDCKPIQLIQFMFSELPVAAFRKLHSHKQDNRLNLLLTCILIEQPDFIKHLQLAEEITNSMPDANKHLSERPFMIKVFQTLQKLSNKLDIMSIEYNFCIPHLKILGIKIIKNNSKVMYIEVLDSSTCLYDTEIPNGMMKLKFRLESKLNFNVITVSQRENVWGNPLSMEFYLESLLSQT